ncbi:hypothetical protein J3R03_004082 [Actinoplanes couchii]|nr:hypothetical protein [Actinoplanes couchii]
MPLSARYCAVALIRPMGMDGQYQSPSTWMAPLLLLRMPSWSSQ